MASETWLKAKKKLWEARPAANSFELKNLNQNTVSHGVHGEHRETKTILESVIPSPIRYPFLESGMTIVVYETTVDKPKNSF